MTTTMTARRLGNGVTIVQCGVLDATVIEVVRDGHPAVIYSGQYFPGAASPRAEIETAILATIRDGDARTVRWDDGRVAMTPAARREHEQLMRRLDDGGEPRE